MAKALLAKHARAIELRKMGWSYPVIKKELNVSKASLSLWLRNYPLTERQIRRLKSNSQAMRIEHFRETFRKKREYILKLAYEEQSVGIGKLNKREIYLMGLMLYWGEGMKATRGTISFSNTNPAMIRMAIYWLVDCMGFSRSSLRVKLHLYSDMNFEKEQLFWAHQLNLPLTQFKQPYIKTSLLGNLTQKGFGHGTCDLNICSTPVKDKIMMGIQVVEDYFSSGGVRI